MLPRIVLASQSPARRKLLEMAGLSFDVQPSHFDEDSIHSDNLAQMVETLALKKAEVVAQQYEHPALIIGADSLFTLEGEVYGKPKDAAEALLRLHHMQGKMGELLTGHALVDTARSRQVSRVRSTYVHLAPMTDAEIRHYIATGEPMVCAGNFALEGYGGVFVDRVDGCHTNVIGLSLPLLRQMFAELDYDITDFW
ncbi:MAG: Maf family protein [Cyanobacteria bacterium J06639_1]